LFEGSLKPDPDVINTDAYTSLILPGAKLQAMTQAKAITVLESISLKFTRL
jgi:hypothetical protein